MRFIYTQHARTALAERALEATWVEETIRHPEWIVADPYRPHVRRYFRSIPERGGRIMRVAVGI